MCHIVLMMPALGLVVFWVWPLNTALPVYLTIVALSGLVYFLILRAMQEPVRSGPEAMIRERGRVIRPLNPEGLVRLHGEIWRAIGLENLPQGASVQVVGVQGLTLLVKEAGSSTPKASGKHCPI